MSETIYLNNAGTSWPKPPQVAAAMADFAAAPPESWASSFEAAQATVVQFFNLPQSDRFWFTLGCTSALSLAVETLPWTANDRVVISHLEHQALVRPIEHLKTRGVDVIVIPYGGPGQPMDLDALDAVLAEGWVRLVAFSMASNVTGELFPVSEIVQRAHAHGAKVLLDSAQAAGVVPIDVGGLGVDLFAFAGHKGPMAPHGIGGLYVAPDLATLSYCDIGSVNMIGMSGLIAGLQWLEAEGLDTVRARVRGLTARLLEGLEALPGVEIFGGLDAAQRTAAVSFRAEAVTPAELETRLREDFSIETRGGRQCAPMAHQAIGTSETGTLRLSAGPFTDDVAIDRTLEALRHLLSK